MKVYKLLCKIKIILKIAWKTGVLAMKKCKECQKLYQGYSCDCGFEESKKQKITPKDDWIFKQRQELNGLKVQISQMNDFLSTAKTELMRCSISNLLLIFHAKLKKVEQTCGASLLEISKIPDEHRCQAYSPESGNCTKFGGMAHFGADSRFCRFHWHV